ncbi:hypothetical protein MTO96_020866 [Rhipicephalus appendiculatus]
MVAEPATDDAPKSPVDVGTAAPEALAETGPSAEPEEQPEEETETQPELALAPEGTTFPAAKRQHRRKQY